MNRLIGLEDVRGSNAGPISTDIESLGQFNELGPRDICSSQEDGNLQPKAGRASR